MGSGFSKMKKQARQMQQQFSQMRDNLQNIEAVGSAGGGLVTATIDGEKNLKKIAIKPECVTPDDVEGLQDLIVAAMQDASAQLEKQQPMNGQNPMNWMG